MKGRRIIREIKMNERGIMNGEVQAEIRVNVPFVKIILSIVPLLIKI